MDTELVKSIGQGAGLGTIAILALVILGRIVARIGERLITAIDRLVEKIDDHTKEDIGAINGLAERMSRMEGKVDAVFEFTPVESPIPKAAGRGAYQYGPRRPGTKDER